jgi:hypothetical protein
MRLIWFLSREGAPINCDHQTNRFERAICAADRSTWRGNRMIMAPTSRDEIERSLVIQEPTPSILAIGQSIIVTTRVRLRSGSAYQGVRSAESLWFASTEEEK